MTRLSQLQDRASILGISISDIIGDADAIEARLASYRAASDSNISKRGGFTKTCAAPSNGR